MSEYPVIKVNGICYLDTPQQRMILIRELEAKNIDLKAEVLILKNQCQMYYQEADDLYSKLRDIQKGLDIDIVKELEKEKQQLNKEILELKHTCTELVVKMHTAINAYEMLKKKNEEAKTKGV